MPPKKTTTKKVLPPSPSGRGPRPSEDHEGHAPAQPELQGDQDCEVPSLHKNDDNQDISFDAEEHDDKANLKHEEIKGEEECDQPTEDVGNQILFATCTDDLGITSQGLAMMTEGQLSDLEALCKMNDFDAK